MQGAVVIVVLALAALTTSHPYYPSSNKPSGESVYVQSGKDLVRRPTWQEYAAGLMQGGSKPTEPPDPPMCVAGGTSGSLEKAQLEMILDTVYPVTGNPIPFTNIITPDHGTTVYSNELSPLSASRLSACQAMLEGISEIDNIWSSYSPRPSCAHALLTHFDKPEVGKPTIHIARIYSESSKLTHIVESFQCLAKLIHEGFAIVPWDFNAFKTRDGIPAFSDTCSSVIDAYCRDGNFTSAYMELVSQVTFIQELGQNPHANSWCAS